MLKKNRWTFKHLSNSQTNSKFKQLSDETFVYNCTKIIKDGLNWIKN